MMQAVRTLVCVAVGIVRPLSTSGIDADFVFDLS
jgi:hypothetical protein